MLKLVLLTAVTGLLSGGAIADNVAAAADQTQGLKSLTKAEAEKLTSRLIAQRVESLRKERKAEFDTKSITIDDKTLRYQYKTYGDEPKEGHSLYISMHGGGGAPARVNDQQWKNQINLYQPKEGIYVAPRAPTDTWDLWHQEHIDSLFDRLIENFIAIEGVNPNKVYVMGYSAGGDGTYQLAPRMADRWAGAAMMAGHPGDAQTYNLRNLAYYLQCGGEDKAYNRNLLCEEWGKKLDKLAEENPGAYPHEWKVYKGVGHWMQLRCKVAVPWMAEFTRNPWPKKLHWHQDNVTGTRFFWLANDTPLANQLITAEIDVQSPQTIILTPAGDDFTRLPAITLRLSDQLLNLDQPIAVKTADGAVLFEGKVARTQKAIEQSIQQRPDVTSVATAILEIQL